MQRQDRVLRSPQSDVERLLEMRSSAWQPLYQPLGPSLYLARLGANAAQGTEIGNEMTMRVQTDAARTDRGYNQPDAVKKQRSDRPLLLWRKMVNHAVAEAKKTYNGMPTGIAILARWWIADHRPNETDKADWERSFECACHWLDLKPNDERKRLLAEIDAALWLACQSHFRKVIYQHRAAVLACAGEPMAIARQYVLPLVSVQDYDAIADIDDLFERVG